MAPPIALQLYTLRDTLAKDFDGGIRKVADAGYVGVETASFVYPAREAAAKLFRDLGLKVCGAHIDLPLGEKKNEVLDTMGILGCKVLVCAYFPPEQFTSTDSIKKICDQLNEGDAVARANGLTVFYHNHWWEYENRVDGRPAYKVMAEHLAPTVKLELDTYWIKTGGGDAAAVIKEFGSRAPLLHIKDGPATREADMVAVGDGIMDWQAIVNASASTAEWMIVELDRCATDMMEAVVKSEKYLVQKGFANGR